MKKFYEYFEITTASKKKGKKTDTYIITSRKGDSLGVIKWYGAWRQYSFFPETGTIWNQGCLDDIAGFLQNLKRKQKEKRKKRCIYGTGKGNEQRCVYSLSEYHGVKTDGDPKKEPCKSCDRFRDEPPLSARDIVRNLDRAMRQVNRSVASIEVLEKKPAPLIPSDNMED